MTGTCTYIFEPMCRIAPQIDTLKPGISQNSRCSRLSTCAYVGTDGYPAAEKSEGERRVKFERAEKNLVHMNASLMRKLTLYDRAHGEIMNGVTTT